MSYAKPLPALDDPVTGPSWQGFRQRRVLAQRCSFCGLLRWPPALVCPGCLRRDAVWTELSQVGKVWSYVVYHRAFAPAFAGDVPYAVAIVELPEGPRIAGRLVADLTDIRVGMRVAAAFNDVTDAVTLLEWIALPDNERN